MKLSSGKYRHRKPDDLLRVTQHNLLILSPVLFLINTTILFVVLKIRYSTVGLPAVEKENRKVFSRIYEAHYGKLNLILRSVIPLSNEKNNGLPCKQQLCVILRISSRFQPKRQSFVWCEYIRCILVILILSTFEFFVIFFHILFPCFATCQKLWDPENFFFFMCPCLYSPHMITLLQKYVIFFCLNPYPNLILF